MLQGGPGTGWLDQDRGWGSGIVFRQVVDALLCPFFWMELLWWAGREVQRLFSVVPCDAGCGAVRYGTVLLRRWCRAE